MSYRSEPQSGVDVYLSYSRDSIGSRIVERRLEDQDNVLAELGGSAHVQPQRDGRSLVIDLVSTGSWSLPAERQRALSWLRARTNDLVTC